MPVPIGCSFTKARQANKHIPEAACATATYISAGGEGCHKGPQRRASVRCCSKYQSLLALNADSDHHTPNTPQPDTDSYSWSVAREGRLTPPFFLVFRFRVYFQLCESCAEKVVSQASLDCDLCEGGLAPSVAEFAAPDPAGPRKGCSRLPSSQQPWVLLGPRPKDQRRDRRRVVVHPRHALQGLLAPQALHSPPRASVGRRRPSSRCGRRIALRKMKGASAIATLSATSRPVPVPTTHS